MKYVRLPRVDAPHTKVAAIVIAAFVAGLFIEFAHRYQRRSRTLHCPASNHRYRTPVLLESFCRD